ncbi:hypothetical protein [Herbiconiux ginsengi]|uniref:hypothetical protein n=1 Tax=Herbiconiux ginsengi TaxID=381665 RepID=UPI000B89A868|nr:hypothetical protein [Herbiconiux ginsengi]
MSVFVGGPPHDEGLIESAMLVMHEGRGLRPGVDQPMHVGGDGFVADIDNHAATITNDPRPCVALPWLVSHSAARPHAPRRAGETIETSAYVSIMCELLADDAHMRKHALMEALSRRWIDRDRRETKKSGAAWGCAGFAPNQSISAPQGGNTTDLTWTFGCGDRI